MQREPSKNQLAAMAAHRYRIVDSCATCSFGPMSMGYGQGWSRCHELRYKNPDHGMMEPLPTHVSLICDRHIRAPWVDRNLGFYATKPWEHCDRPVICTCMVCGCVFEPDDLIIAVDLVNCCIKCDGIVRRAAMEAKQGTE